MDIYRPCLLHIISGRNQSYYLEYIGILFHKLPQVGEGKNKIIVVNKSNQETRLIKSDQRIEVIKSDQGIELIR